MRITILIILLLAFGILPAKAGYDEAEAAIEKEDYATALRELYPLAEAGDPRAQVSLGTLFLNGDGVPKDEVQASRWYRKAADRGFALGQTSLGQSYFFGLGVPKNLNLAFRLFSQAAEQDSVEGIASLGVAYLEGGGVEKDQVKALALFRQAAERGSAMAQRMMGVMFREGWGTQKNEKTAFDWYLMAAQQGVYNAQLWVSSFYNDGQGVQSNAVKAYMWSLLATAQRGDPSAFAFDQGFAMRKAIMLKHRLTKEQIVESMRLANDWVSSRNPYRYNRGARELIEKARVGDAQTQYRLAQRYIVGERVITNYAEAATWFRAAAKQGHGRAQAALGGLYLSGLGVSKDDKAAAGWFRKSATQGDEYGQANLGILYGEGKGVSRDPVRAHMWLNLATSHAPAFERNPNNKNRPLYLRDQASLALDGHEIRLAQEMAVDWIRINEPERFRKALAKHLVFANGGDTRAQIEIGKLFHDGAAVPQSYAEALKWYRRAIEGGDESAKFWLGMMYENGHGVAKSYRTAFDNYRQAANHNPGDAKAQFSLATYYRYGRVGPKDAVKAAEWYLRAANQGLRIAQLTVSKMYTSGEGVEQNDSGAYKWCTVVITRGAPIQIYKSAQSLCQTLRGRINAFDRKRAEQWVSAWIAKNPSLKTDEYWLRLMGRDTITINPSEIIRLR